MKIRHYTLSVICPSLVCRQGMSDILAYLGRQAKRKRCEVLSLADNGVMTIGEKMNVLNAMARGRYISCVADDDRVAPDYVDTLLAGLEPGEVEVLTFNICFTWNGDRAPIGNRTQPADYPAGYRSIAAVRAEICREFKYRPLNQGEDSEFRHWLGKREPLTQHIDRSLYFSHYRHNKPEFGGMTYARTGLNL